MRMRVGAQQRRQLSTLMHWGKGCGEQPLGRGESGVWASMGWGLLKVGWLDTLGP